MIAAATDARTRARARYSGFQVGAALETADGGIVCGCNIENASYGLTLCAERVALVKALSDGHDVFTRIAVVTGADDLTPPCGPCRQLLWENGGPQCLLLTPEGVLPMSEVLPQAFGPDNLTAAGHPA